MIFKNVDMLLHFHIGNNAFYFNKIKSRSDIFLQSSILFDIILSSEMRRLKPAATSHFQVEWVYPLLFQPRHTN